MDFEGAKLAELLVAILTLLAGGVCFAYGFVAHDFKGML